MASWLTVSPLPAGRAQFPDFAATTADPATDAGVAQLVVVRDIAQQRAGELGSVRPRQSGANTTLAGISFAAERLDFFVFGFGQLPRHITLGHLGPLDVVPDPIDHLRVG